MSNKIFWFSGSGNSLHVAKELQKELKEAELVRVTRDLVGSPGEFSRMGLVFPTYAWGPPAMVADFIESLPKVPIDYVFAVATCGGSAGSVMAITRKLLARRGIELNADFSVKMVPNYPPMGGGAPGMKQQQVINESARMEIDRIASMIRDDFRGSYPKGGSFFSLAGRIVYPMFRRNVSRQADKFHSDEKCTSCGICTRICPDMNIHLDSGGRPEWGRKCQQCFACFHWCPEGAVQFGSKTANQVRYHHPGTSLADMLEGSEG